MKDIVLGIFSHWQSIMAKPRAKMDAKREKAIADRLKDGYSEQDLIDAIDGCALSEFHQGSNDRRQKYNDIMLICRDASHVDKFIEILESAKAEAQRAAQVLEPVDREGARARVTDLRRRITIK